MDKLSLNFLTDEQVRGIFREELETMFSDYLVQPKTDKAESEVVDLGRLIKARPFIGSRSTIYKKVSRGEIPHSKSGKRLIFDLKVIDEWLLSNQIKTTKEIEAETQKYFEGRNKKRRRRAS